MSETVQAPLPQRLMYRKSEAARLLGISVRTVENLIAAKELKARRIGKCVLIPHQVLLDFTRHDHKTVVLVTQVN